MYYLNYVWRHGIPYGKGSTDPQVPRSYLIAMDPYRKRISVEEYLKGEFHRIVYDSALIDFRHLRSEEQAAWQKVEHDSFAWVRNQDHRLMWKEKYQFEKHLCRSCDVISPHGLSLASQKMTYQHLGDPLNTVTLHDILDNPVMRKTYAHDTLTGEFTELLLTEWEFP